MPKDIITTEEFEKSEPDVMSTEDFLKPEKKKKGKFIKKSMLAGLFDSYRGSLQPTTAKAETKQKSSGTTGSLDKPESKIPTSLKLKALGELLMPSKKRPTTFISEVDETIRKVAKPLSKKIEAGPLGQLGVDFVSKKISKGLEETIKKNPKYSKEQQAEEIKKIPATIGRLKEIKKEKAEKYTEEVLTQAAWTIGSTTLSKAPKLAKFIKSKFTPKDANAIFQNLTKNTKTLRKYNKLLRAGKLKGKHLKALEKFRQERIIGGGVKETAQKPIQKIAGLLPEKQVAKVSKTAEIQNIKEPFYNVKKMTTDPKVASTIKQVSNKVKSEVKNIVGKPLTHKEIIDYANKNPQIKDTIITREVTRSEGSALANARKLVNKLSKKGSITPEFEKAFMVDKTQAENVARLQNFRGIPLDKLTGEEKPLMLKVLDNIKKRGEITTDILNKLKGYNLNNLEEATKAYREVVKPKIGEWGALLRYNSMLSSPITHIVNTTSTATSAGIMRPLTKTVTGAIDFIGSKFTGKPRTDLVGEGAVYAKEYLKLKNLKTASKKFFNILSGKELSDMQVERYDLPLTVKGSKGRIAENILRVPLKLLQAEDEFFMTLATAGEEAALKYKGKKINGIKDIAKNAKLSAKESLYNQELGLDKNNGFIKAIEYIPRMVQKAQASKINAVRWTSKLIFPFVRVPANLVKAGVESSPLGFFSVKGAESPKEQLSKAIIGSGIVTGIMTQVASDRITGMPPTGEEERTRWEAAGRQSWSVMVGNKWVSYQRLPPQIAFPMAMAATVKDAFNSGEITATDEKKIMDGLAQWYYFIGDQSYLKNIGDFMRATQGNESSFARTLSSYPQQFIPGRALQGYVARIMDTVKRKPDNLDGALKKQFQYILTQVPKLSEKVPAKLGPLGEEIKATPLERISRAISPVKITEVRPEQEKYLKTTERIKEVRKVKDAFLKNLSAGRIDASNEILGKMYKSDKFTQEQKESFVEVYDKIIEKMKTDEFINSPETVRNKVLSQLLNAAFIDSSIEPKLEKQLTDLEIKYKDRDKRDRYQKNLKTYLEKRSK